MQRWAVYVTAMIHAVYVSVSFRLRRSYIGFCGFRKSPSARLWVVMFSFLCSAAACLLQFRCKLVALSLQSFCTLTASLLHSYCNAFAAVLQACLQHCCNWFVELCCNNFYSCNTKL